MTKILTKNTFVHNILFYLKNPNAEADKNKFLEGIELLSKIPHIQQLHIGTPSISKREVVVSDYTYSLLCIFDSIEEEDHYQIHPLHDEFRNNYEHLWEKVVIYDSTTNTPENQ